MSWNDHDHRGEYAADRHDHDGDYAERHHRHYDLEREDERLQGGLREAMAQVDQLRREVDAQLGEAFARIRQLEDALNRQMPGILGELRMLDGLRPTCVICTDAAADRQTSRGPACTDCAGDLPDGCGPDPDRPETWAFPDPEVTG